MLLLSKSILIGLKIKPSLLYPPQKARLIIVFLITLNVISLANGNIYLNVYLKDSNTPLQLVNPEVPHVYNDILVGTKLKIIVSSDTNECWTDGMGGDGGSLAIPEEHLPYGILSAREPLEGEDWSGSHLPAGGSPAAVYEWFPFGFDFYTGSNNIEIGDWFIFDFEAIDCGSCYVSFYDHLISWDFPIYNLCFTIVRTCDLNADNIVNFEDYEVLLSHWQETNCQSPSWCEGADFDIDGNVDIEDLMHFCEFWLEKTR